MYPSAMSAVIAAFNINLYGDLTGPAWGQFIRDGWGYDHIDLRQVTGQMCRSDWVTQSGKVSNLLRRELGFMDYAWLKGTHTFDKRELLQFIHDPDAGLYVTLVPAVLSDSRIPPTGRLKKSEIKLAGERMPTVAPLIVRAINKNMIPDLPTLAGEATQRTISNWQSTVRRIVNENRERVLSEALSIVEQADGLVAKEH